MARRLPPGIDWSEGIEERAVFAFMDDAAGRFVENRCIDFLGKTYTYREIGEQVNRAAKGFQHLGVGKGVKVGLCLPNTPYAVIYSSRTSSRRSRCRYTSSSGTICPRR